ncbi:MAG: hypothetical protein O7157_03375 [Wolbachia endosymbiont of Tetragnatha montana]|nr:hypothetical protein [Wolbachia endosymbiont of Tetragnatha montana]
MTRASFAFFFACLNIYTEGVIPVWNPVFHIISSKMFFCANLQANFSGSQCLGTGMIL